MRGGALGVARPDRGGEAVGAVVHQRDRLVVGVDRHDADDRAEALLAHHRHAVVHVDQHLRRHVGVPGASRGKRRGSTSARAPCATASAICPRTKSAASALAPSAPAWSPRSSGSPSTYSQRQRDEAARRSASYTRAMHVDALDAAAALPGVEERAVDQVLDRVLEVGVGAHVGRVLAAEFEARRRVKCRPRRARPRARPRTEPVKFTWSTRGRTRSRAAACAWSSTRCWKRPCGQAAPRRRPRRSARRPAASAPACFRITALPAISAGTIELTAVR